MQTQMTNFRQNGQGFSLIEVIVVMVITGILAAIVASFITTPIQSYADTARRAELTDAADTALRRIERDLHSGLPNSVRIAENPAGSGIWYLEFLPTKGGGRYRAELDGAGGGDILDFTSDTDSSFDVLGPTVTLAAGDQIVVYNLGIPGADAYVGMNRRAIAGAVGALNNVGYTPMAGQPFPLESPGKRFQIVATPVTYVCNPAAGTLTRFWGYPIDNVWPKAAPIAGASSALVTTHVSSCQFTYVAGASERSGQVTIRLQLSSANVSGVNETVSLYAEVNVNNVP